MHCVSERISSIAIRSMRAGSLGPIEQAICRTPHAPTSTETDIDHTLARIPLAVVWRSVPRAWQYTVN
jgi:hypothetical protein